MRESHDNKEIIPVLVFGLLSFMAGFVGSYFFSYCGGAIAVMIVFIGLILHTFEGLRRKAKSLLVEYLEYMGKYPMW
jgi:hypothetical protein